MRNFFGGVITENYNWELAIFHKVRQGSDGIDFFEFVIKYDKYLCDHNPRFEFTLRLFNYTIFEFGIFNVWHTDDPNSPYYNVNEDKDLTFDGDFEPTALIMKETTTIEI